MRLSRNLGYWSWINNSLCRLSGAVGGDFLFSSFALPLELGVFSDSVRRDLLGSPLEIIYEIFHLKIIVFPSHDTTEIFRKPNSHSPTIRGSGQTTRNPFDYRLKIMRHEKHVMFVKFMRYGYRWKIFSLVSLFDYSFQGKKLFATPCERCAEWVNNVS